MDKFKAFFDQRTVGVILVTAMIVATAVGSCSGRKTPVESEKDAFAGIRYQLTHPYPGWDCVNALQVEMERFQMSCTFNGKLVLQ